MRVLAIDTSNQTLSVAVCEDDTVLGQYTLNIKQNHSLTLMPVITELVAAVGLKPAQLDRIVVAQGPGSYTGLRIGVTTAKTLAYTLNKELVGISSLEVLAANASYFKGVVVPIFDARRNNVYSGVYQFDEQGRSTCLLADRHVALAEWVAELRAYETICFVGADTAKFAEQIQDACPQATFMKEPFAQIPQAAVLARLGQLVDPISDIHNFLPEYLKRVEAEEKWLATNTPLDGPYVEKL